MCGFGARGLAPPVCCCALAPLYKSLEVPLEALCAKKVRSEMKKSGLARVRSDLLFETQGISRNSGRAGPGRQFRSLGMDHQTGVDMSSFPLLARAQGTSGAETLAGGRARIICGAGRKPAGALGSSRERAGPA